VSIRAWRVRRYGEPANALQIDEVGDVHSHDDPLQSDGGVMAREGRLRGRG